MNGFCGFLFVCFCHCVYMCIPGACRGQKESDPLEMELLIVINEMPHGCWEQNLGSVKKHQKLLTLEPLQPSSASLVGAAGSSFVHL